MKEFFVGVVNGVLLGALLGAVVHWWRGDWGLAAVVAVAYAAACALAVLLGGGLPLLLRRFGIDPAMLASPILTTLTDMSAFFFSAFSGKIFSCCALSLKSMSARIRHRYHANSYRRCCSH